LGGGLLGAIGEVGGIATIASGIASLMGARNLAAGLQVASQAASVVSQFTRIRHPRGHDVVVGACHRDKPDPNDRLYDRHQRIDKNVLPPLVDLRPYMSEIEDQGELGSCTANAIAGAHEYLQNRIKGNYTDVSRLFIYYLERKEENAVDEDSGGYLRDGMKALQSYGVCSEEIWPYDVNSWRDEPPQEAFDDAASHTIDEYHRVPVELDAMRTCLAEGYPFVLGLELYKSFESHGHHGHHGHIAMPRSGEKDIGSHAMLCVGYSDSDKVFLVRNSWGTDWGDQGYCYVPYAYLANDEYTNDCWTLRKSHNLDFSQDIHGHAQHTRQDGSRSFFADVEGVVDIAAGIFGGRSFL
jgi:C1A family cysteine protease